MNKQIIEIFNQIRDTPYRIPLSLEETNYCCSGKSIILKNKLESLGYKARFAVGSFLWSCLSLPEVINNIPHDSDSTHSWAEVYINNHWIKLDPSWDKELSSIFTISEFDGQHDTKLAVKIEDFFSPEKSDEIMNNQGVEADKLVTEDLDRNGTFYEALNSYFIKIRKSNINV